MNKPKWFKCILEVQRGQSMGQWHVFCFSF